MNHEEAEADGSLSYGLINVDYGLFPSLSLPVAQNDVEMDVVFLAQRC